MDLNIGTLEMASFVVGAKKSLAGQTITITSRAGGTDWNKGS